MKKEERLANIIGQISDDMLEQAANVDNKRCFDRLLAYKVAWKKWTAIAACMALIIGVVAFSLITFGPKTHSKLPILSLDTKGFFTGGMGFEGYMAYDISELKNANPWSEEVNVTHLPVFKNVHTYDENYQVPDADINKMKACLKEIAQRLGIDAEQLEITDDRPDEETINKITEKLRDTVPEYYYNINRVFIKDKGIEVEVNGALTAAVKFNPPVSLPNEYNFTYYAPYEDFVSVADYLSNKYKAFINMKKPKANITGGDYDIYNQQNYSIEFFDENGNILEQMINYNFNKVTFNCDDDGNLFGAGVFQPDLSHKIGNYPVITPNEAKRLLSKGNYITTVPEEFSGEEYGRKIELIYRTNGTEKIFLPYYRIYVEMPSMKRDNGINTYGAFYVPAVNGKYIENMPIWDGSFN